MKKILGKETSFNVPNHRFACLMWSHESEYCETLPYPVSHLPSLWSIKYVNQHNAEYTNHILVRCHCLLLSTFEIQASLTVCHEAQLLLPFAPVTTEVKKGKVLASPLSLFKMCIYCHIVMSCPISATQKLTTWEKYSPQDKLHYFLKSTNGNALL